MEITKKIVLLGHFGVGKSSLVRRFLSNVFEQDYMPTLGVQIQKKLIALPNGNTLSMIVWDLEGFSSVARTRASYLLGSNGFIYVFDLGRPYTYHELDTEVAFIKKKYPKVALVVVGNKIDEESSEDVQSYLLKKGVVVDSFVSAKTGEGVQEMFMEMAKRMAL